MQLKVVQLGVEGGFLTVKISRYPFIFFLKKVFDTYANHDKIDKWSILWYLVVIPQQVLLVTTCIGTRLILNTNYNNT